MKNNKKKFSYNHHKTIPEIHTCTSEDFYKSNLIKQTRKYMYAYINIFAFSSICGRLCVCVLAYVCIYLHMWCNTWWTCVCTCMCMYVCVHKCVFVCERKCVLTCVALCCVVFYE